MQNQLYLKILVVGDVSVGKTSILNRYCNGGFHSQMYPTIGCDFTLKILDNFQDRKISLQLWDVAGSERFQSVSKLYLRGACGCIIVCDTVSESSVLNCIKWHQIVRENTDLPDEQNIKLPTIILQNKLDLLENLQEKPEFVSEQYLKSIAKQQGYDGAFQVSAKNNININQSIEFLVDSIFNSNILTYRHQSKVSLQEYCFKDLKGSNVYDTTQNKLSKCC